MNIIDFKQQNANGLINKQNNTNEFRTKQKNATWQAPRQEVLLLFLASVHQNLEAGWFMFGNIVNFTMNVLFIRLVVCCSGWQP